MRRLFAVFIVFMLVFGIANAGYANLIENGDFETGNASGWVADGDVDITIAGCLATLQGMDNYYALFGSDQTEGTASITQSFDATGYTEFTISFNWAFDFADFSWSENDTFISILSSDYDSSFAITMLDLESGLWFGEKFGVGLQSGYFTKTFDLSEIDIATLSFILTEGSGWTCSIAGIDNVSVVGGTAAPVPEPATMLLLGTGLTGLAFFARKGKSIR